MVLYVLGQRRRVRRGTFVLLGLSNSGKTALFYQVRPRRRWSTWHTRNSLSALSSPLSLPSLPPSPPPSLTLSNSNSSLTLFELHPPNPALSLSFGVGRR